MVGGVALIYLTLSSMKLVYWRYNNTLLLLGGLISLAGLLQPLIDVTQVVYFTTDGMRYRRNLFLQIQKHWSEIKGVVFQDNDFLVEFKKGRSIRMVPYDADSQNLRVHIDKLMIHAKSIGRPPSANDNLHDDALHHESGSMA
jgi:hypothetical protein